MDGPGMESGPTVGILPLNSYGQKRGTIVSVSSMSVAPSIPKVSMSVPPCIPEVIGNDDGGVRVDFGIVQSGSFSDHRVMVRLEDQYLIGF